MATYCHMFSYINIRQDENRTLKSACPCYANTVCGVDEVYNNLEVVSTCNSKVLSSVIKCNHSR